MGQPAHDGLVGADHLLAINAEILTLLVRPLRYHQGPGDEWGRVPRPAGLDRVAAKIDVSALINDFLTGRMTDDLGRHVEHLTEHGQLVKEVAKALRRLGLFEKSQEAADIPQGMDGFLTHPERHTLRRPKKVRKQRNVIARGLLKEERRPFGLKGTITDLGHLKIRVDRRLDAL